MVRARRGRRAGGGDQPPLARHEVEAPEIVQAPELALPPGLPFGTYITEFFLFEKGRVVGYQTGKLSVAITGLEQWLRVTAHDMPLLYGLFGVFIAGLMGWGVATLFRRV